MNKEKEMTCKDCFHWVVCQGDAPYYSAGAEHCTSWASAEDINAPTIEPERPKGWWVRQLGDFKCSMCGSEEEYKSRYCPNCGTDMRGESE